MIVEVKDLSYAYNGNEVLRDVSLNIKEKDFVAVIGRNGSGKTTLIKLILGTLNLQGGMINVFGEYIGNFKNWQWIGYVPQRFDIDKNFPASVYELLSLKNESKKKETIKILDISDLLEKRFSNLSGGQQQKVMIALSLMSNPKLLILDEPTVGVDIKAQQDFYSLLKKLNEKMGLTIILVTHDVGLISKYVKSVICLNGSICCCGKAHETEKLLKQVYGKDFHMHHH